MRQIASLMASIALASCGGDSLDVLASGSISLAVTEAPADVSCLIIEVVGTRTEVRRFNMVEGRSTELNIGGLPLGDVLVSGAAYDEACTAVDDTTVAGWVGGPVEGSIEIATATVVVLPMHRNGRAEVDADFVDEAECRADGTTCEADTQCCSLACLPSSSTPDTSTCQAAISSCLPGDGGDPCDTGAVGVCEQGVTACVDGALTCEPLTTAVAEVCDGLDNDCDGVADDGNPGGGYICNTGEPFRCAQGTLTCVDGAVQCIQDYLPTAEVCDGMDNDCDGFGDEGNPGGGASCATGLPGVCAAGTTACVSGAVQCQQNVLASAEVCGDGLDNDCDGFIDDGCP